VAAFAVWFVIVLFFFGGWVAFLEIVAKGQHDYSQGDTQASNGGNVSRPASLKPTAPSDQSQSGKGDGDSKPSLTDWVQAGSAVAIVLLTGAILFVYSRQTHIMARQERRMRQTIATMDKHAKRQLRAYVSIRAEITRPVGILNVVTCTFTFRNTGATPAYYVERWFHFWTAPFPGLPGMHEMDEFEETIVIAPNDETAIVAQIELGPGDFYAMMRDQAFWATAEVSYEDTFDSKWETEALFRMGGDEYEAGRMLVETYRAT